MTTWPPYPREIVYLTDRQIEVSGWAQWTKYQLRDWLKKVHDGPLLHPGKHPFAC